MTSGTFGNTYRTTSEALAASLERATIERCNAGRHTTGCPHRPCSPWVRRALGLVAESLPAIDLTGHIKVNNK